MPPKPDYDQALKRLLLLAHDGFLELTAPELKWRGEISPELPATTRRADMAWEVEFPDGQRGILHVELQTKADPTIGERLLEYGVRLWQREHLPVRSVVVYLRPAEQLPTSPFVIPWGASESIRCMFDTIRLWEIPAERLLSTNHYYLWPLASLAADATPDSTVEVAQRIAAAPLERHERAELASALILFAGLRMPRAALADAVRRAYMIDDIWKESSFAGAVFDLGVEEGLEKGLVRGREEGRAAGMRALTQTALEGRFGPLSEELRTALQAAGDTVLMGIVANLQVETLDDVKARLGIS